jgi:hypothetical protein
MSEACVLCGAKMIRELFGGEMMNICYNPKCDVGEDNLKSRRQGRHMSDWNPMVRE